MRPRRLLPSLGLVVVLSAGGIGSISAKADLPSRLSDQAFWQLSRDSSEPDGVFQSDNLLSNEIVFGRLVPDLAARTKPGGVYLGVGPEQNFTYIAAMKPRIAFITDIRRGNLHAQLMYKALFELSKDRAEFVSRLFTKPRPAALTATSTVLEIMNAYWDGFSADEAAFQSNLEAVHSLLTKTHRIPLEQADLDGIAGVYRAFYLNGPSITYSARTGATADQVRSRAYSSNGNGTYWAMMTQTDASGQPFSYLASEESFAVLKDLESRNLIVPVVGNFSGPKALRAVGAYIKDHDATVSAFYLSNVESYLQRDGTWPAFCGNVATFPLDDASVFIRPSAISIINAPVGTLTTTQGAPLQFLQFQGGSTVTTNPPRVSFNVVLPLSNAVGPVNSAELVPPAAPAARPAPSNNQLLPAGLIPIKNQVSGCTAK